MTDLLPELLTTAEVVVAEPSEPEPKGLKDLGAENLSGSELALPEVPPLEALPPLEGDGLAAGGSVTEGEATLTTAQSLKEIDTLFFYAQENGEAPVLMAVDLHDGTLAIAEEPLELFPTALSGLLAVEPTIAPWRTQPELGGGALSVPGAEAGLAAGPEAPGIPELAASALETAELGPAESRPLAFTLVVGSDDKNFLLGTVARSALFGLGSDDLLIVAEEEGIAFGGLGDDTVIGGSGNDILFGNAGDDFLEGDLGDDIVFGGDGDDILYGGAGANVLLGGAGADTFRLGQAIAYGVALVGEAEAIAPTVVPATIVDFNAAEGDRLDLSLIASQPMFSGLSLQPFLSFVQVEADTYVQVTSPLGQTSTEAVLLGVEADSLGLENLILTATGMPPYK
jgi:Ca2+-binding RTX toxin-like protein